LSEVDRPLRRVEIVRARDREHPGIDALWLVRETSASLSAGANARAGLVALEAAGSERTLGKDALVRAMAERRGAAALALYGDLSPFGRGSGGAPLFITIGKDSENMRLAGEVSRAGVLVLASRLVSP
jgi:hypothetical protein